MMFQYNDLCTIYSSNGDVDTKFDFDCCFHVVTKDRPEANMKNKYTIRLVKDPEFSNNYNKNNYCPYSLEQIEKYLKFLNTIYPFKYSVDDYHGNILNLSEDEASDLLEEDYDGDESILCELDCYDITLEIDGALIYHKLILKLIRPLYEFPFNLILHDVFKIQKEVPELSKLGFFNLYNYIGIVFHNSKFEALGDQFISSFSDRDVPKFISVGKLKDKLKDLSNADIDDQDICGNLMEYKSFSDPIGVYDFLVSIPGYREFFYETNNMFEINWDNEERFNTRLKFYKELINKILN